MSVNNPFDNNKNYDKILKYSLDENSINELLFYISSYKFPNPNISHIQKFIDLIQLIKY